MFFDPFYKFITLIYFLLKPVIRIALRLFCKKVEVENSWALKQKGPLLIISNHPNTFLDALIIAAYTKYPIHFLARGDAFKRTDFRFLLSILNIIPIYQLKHDKDNLNLNEYAFKKSNEILSKGGILLLFIEGISLNTHQLQNFKKGAARMALAYNGLSPLKLLPIGITYDNFNIYGKTVKLKMGKIILVPDLLPFKEEAKNLNYFNHYLYARLKDLIGMYSDNQPLNINIFLKTGVFLGRFLHHFLYHILRNFVAKKTAGTAFYDAVLFGVLFLCYPIYLLLVVWVLLLFNISIWTIGLILILFLLSARVAVLFSSKKQTF